MTIFLLELLILMRKGKMKEGKGMDSDYPNAGGPQRLFGLLLRLEPSVIPKQVRVLVSGIVVKLSKPVLKISEEVEEIRNAVPSEN